MQEVFNTTLLQDFLSYCIYDRDTYNGILTDFGGSDLSPAQREELIRQFISEYHNWKRTKKVIIEIENHAQDLFETLTLGCGLNSNDAYIKLHIKDTLESLYKALKS